MIEQLESWDRKIFFAINEGLSNPFFDALLPLWRNKLFWIPLYCLLFYLCFRWFRKSLGLIIVFSALLVTVSDQMSSAVVKPTVERLRPCKNGDIKDRVKLRLKGCGAGYSFTSSHATNHFALAVFFGLLFLPKNRAWLLGGFLWAGSISLSQVYVGVHYPSDIFFGALLGSVIGASLFYLFRKTSIRLNLQH